MGRPAVQGCPGLGGVWPILGLSLGSRLSSDINHIFHCQFPWSQGCYFDVPSAPFCVCHLIGSKPGKQVIYWPLVFHSLLNLQPTGMDLTCPEQTWASGACPPSLPGGHLSCVPHHDPGIQPCVILPPLPISAAASLPWAAPLTWSTRMESADQPSPLPSGRRLPKASCHSGPGGWAPAHKLSQARGPPLGVPEAPPALAQHRSPDRHPPTALCPASFPAHHTPFP